MKLIGLSEMAAQLGMKTDTLRRKARKGQVPCIRLPNPERSGYRFNPTAVMFTLRAETLVRENQAENASGSSADRPGGV